LSVLVPTVRHAFSLARRASVANLRWQRRYAPRTATRLGCCGWSTSLYFSRIEAGRLEASYEAVDLANQCALRSAAND
jgi:hypothetical protein